ncbi:MAG: alanine racemase [Candidatus Aminicenantes bacterium]|nr:alanine racemase [Candidatus Aminicenantes bacterium]
MTLKKQDSKKANRKESSYTYRLLKTWAEINLGAVRFNIKNIQKKLGKDIDLMAIVKCNAYGHGAIEVSRQALDLGVKALGVSSLYEGIELRDVFKDVPIIVLSSGMSGQAEEFIEYNLSPVVCSWEMTNALADAARKRGTRANVHIKVDTGMGRIGVWHERADEFIRQVYKMPDIEIEGVCSHFATSDEQNLDFARKQFDWFNRCLEKIKDLPIRFKHISNTGAIFNLPEAHLNMVRPGLSIYGVSPSEYVKGAEKLRPALSLKTKIAFLKSIPKGRTLSYARTYKTKKQMKVATLPVGYGDGYPLSLSNKGYVLIRGKKAQILGAVTMDQIMVDVTGIKDVKTEDVAVLIGKQGNEEITATEVARIAGTVPYEIFTSINKRVQRIYSGRD